MNPLQTLQESHEKEKQELEVKLLLQLQENSELLDQFNSLKTQHLHLVQEQSLSYDNINVKQRQLEQKDREIKDRDLVIKEKEKLLAEKELELVEISHQLMIAQKQNLVSFNTVKFYCSMTPVLFIFFFN